MKISMRGWRRLLAARPLQAGWHRIKRTGNSWRKRMLHLSKKYRLKYLGWR
jgi:hypothetical protein